jgi:hypothetical protein
MEPGLAHKLRTINRIMNLDWSDHRHNTKIEDMYLKFLIPQAPYVEKIMNLHHRFDKFETKK